MKPDSLKGTALIFVLSLLASCGGGGGGAGGGGGGGGLADLVVTTFSAPSSGVAGTSYAVTGTITNQGGVMGAGAAVIYLSPSSDVSVDGGQVGMEVYMGFLNPGQSWNFSTTITLPKNVANGSYYIGAIAMGDDPSVQGNNTASHPITISGGTTCSSDIFEADNTYSGTTNQLTFAVSQQHNHCEGTSDWMKFTATGGTVYGVSAARVGSKSSPILSIYGTDGKTLLANTSYAGFLVSRATWTAPANGTYYIKAAPWNGVASGGANTEYLVTVGDMRPDLVVDTFTAPAAGLPGGIIWVSDAVRNQGFVSAGTFTVSLYLSADSTVTTSDTLIGSRMVGSLAMDQSSYSSAQYTLPNVAPGQYSLAAIVNPTGSLSEFTVSNNTSTVIPITVQSLGACTPDAYEQDDLYASTMNTVTVGAPPQQHNHCDDAVDWIKLDMTNSSSYSIRIVRSNLSSAWVELYDTNGTTKLAGDWQYGTIAIDYTAPASGTYYLKVGGTTGDGKDYTVQVQPQLPDLVQTLTPSNGTTVPAGGFLNVTDMVSNIGYLDAGAFEIGFYYSTSSSVTTSDSLGATRSITGLPSSGYQSSNQSWANYVHFPKSLPTGTYYLAAIADRNGAVAELNETNNTSQALAITVTAPSCASDAYEDDDAAANAKTIASGETQNRNFCDDGSDWINFTPSATGVYVAYSPTQTGYLEVYQSDGVTPVALHDTYFYSKVSWYATAGVTYLLKYYTYQGATSGAYQFILFPCVQDAYEDDDTLAAAKPIAINETQSRNHCDDRYDWAKFDAVAGTSYTITTTNGQNVYLTLYDGVSPYALAGGQPAQGGKLRVINWTAPASGTYYIEMDRFEFGQNTDYTLNLK